jgi:hypothetical protein
MLLEVWIGPARLRPEWKSRQAQLQIAVTNCSFCGARVVDLDCFTGGHRFRRQGRGLSNLLCLVQHDGSVVIGCIWVTAAIDGTAPPVPSLRSSGDAHFSRSPTKTVGQESKPSRGRSGYDWYLLQLSFHGKATGRCACPVASLLTIRAHARLRSTGNILVPRLTPKINRLSVVLIEAIGAFPMEPNADDTRGHCHGTHDCCLARYADLSISRALPVLGTLARAHTH